MSIISRQGGKSRLYKTLIPLFPEHEYYVEIFGGAGWVLLNKPESTIETFNDIDGNLVNLFRVIRDFPGEFTNRLQYDIVSRQTFDDYKQLPFHALDPIDRAVKWYYVYYNSFNADMTSFLARKVKTNPNRFNTRLPVLTQQIADRLSNVIIENLDFRDMFLKYKGPDVFYFLDPPYYETTGYEVPFLEKDHVDLRTVVGNIDGKFLMTYNAHDAIIDMYGDDFWITPLSVNYQCANRPGAYKDKTNIAREVAITNYDPGNVDSIVDSILVVD